VRFRWGLALVAALLIGASLAYAASASGTRTLHYACANRATGVLRGVSSLSACHAYERGVRFGHGKVFTCVFGGPATDPVRERFPDGDEPGVISLARSALPSACEHRRIGEDPPLTLSGNKPVTVCMNRSNGTLWLPLLGACSADQVRVVIPASTPPIKPPIARDDKARTDSAHTVTIAVLKNDSDPQHLALHIASLGTAGTKGKVSIVAGTRVLYDPNGKFNYLTGHQKATDSFTYRDSDGKLLSNVATVTVTITGVNHAPVLANIETSALQYDAGTPAVPVTSTLTVASRDTTGLVGAKVSIGSGFTASEDELGFTNQNGITGSYNATTGVLTLTGTASVADYQTALRSVTYRDSNGASASTGSRAISFQVNDGRSSNNLSNPLSRTINVKPNSPPTAGNVSASTDKLTATDVNVLGSDSDPDGDTLSVVAVNPSGTKGSVSINSNNTIHYDPNGQFSGLLAGQTATDTFGYTVSDGYTTASATVTVTITGVNDPPVLANIETSTLQYEAGTPAVPVTSALTVTSPTPPPWPARRSRSPPGSRRAKTRCRSRTRTGSPAATTPPPGS
jgi:VCBS repeat-containing protein